MRKMKNRKNEFNKCKRLMFEIWMRDMIDEIDDLIDQNWSNDETYSSLKLQKEMLNKVRDKYYEIKSL